jgi:hypothetical protein
MAIELPNGSWIQRTEAAGSIVRPVCSKRRSWLSARPEHQAVLAQHHRRRIVVSRVVDDLERAHGAR